MVENGGRGRGYHHGDLRNALVAAALELAVEGGPGQVVLREAARRVGVSATAAYRHFAGHEQLLYAVKGLCQQALADRMDKGRQEEEERAEAAGELESASPEADAAVRRLTAIGRAYVRFGLENPGLYRTAFVRAYLDDNEADFDGVHHGGGAEFRSFTQLTEALDAMVATGAMPAHNRPYAEITAWSSVHGLVLLILDGPLGNLPPAEREVVIERVLAASVAVHLH